MKATKTKKKKEQLLAEKEKLLADIEMLKETLRGEVNVDVDEGDPDVTEREKSLALLSTLRVHLTSVEDALEALEKGTYGICDRCGEPIRPERLEVKPDAIYCVTCQGEIERLQRRGIFVPSRR